MSKHVRIKDLPLSDRPQERLFRYGAQSISFTDLVAVLIGTGSRTQSAVQLAKKIVRGLSNIHTESLETFLKTIQIKGFGKVKQARVIAAFELGKRFFRAQRLETVCIRNGQDAVLYLRGTLMGNQERLYALYVNARNELIQKELVAKGTLNMTHVSIRDILGKAFVLPCAGVVIAHNHPSGNPMPSDEDVILTDALQQAAELLHIVLIDHVILGKNGFFSFHDNTVHAYGVS